MSVGAIELIVVVACFLMCVPIWLANGKRWVALIPLFFLIAMFTTPADLISLLLVGIPNSVVGICLYRLASRPEAVQSS